MTSTHRIFIVTRLVGSAFFVTAMADADIIEVRGKGIMNGKILSETAVETRFKDHSGHEIVFLKKDVLFSEIQPDAPKTNKIVEGTKQLIRKTATALSSPPDFAIPASPAPSAKSGKVAPWDLIGAYQQAAAGHAASIDRRVDAVYDDMLREQRSTEAHMRSAGAVQDVARPEKFESLSSDEVILGSVRRERAGSAVTRFKDQASKYRS